MSEKIDRRQFLVRSGGVIAGLTLAGTFTESTARALLRARLPGDAVVDRVPLGRSGLVVSRVAMGTGTVGGGSESNQTRLGQEIFSAMFRHGYERGLRFIDTAETYGSIPFAGRAIAGLPRENITVLTKMMTQADNSPRFEPVRPRIEGYLRQLDSDYIDILLMHCMMQGGWNTTRTQHMEAFAKAKEDGLVRAVGVSCHNLDAVRTAATEPWVDVILTRINPYGTLMDGPPEQVREVIATALANGKGVVGMKIFGEGKHVAEQERERSIRHAIHEARVDAMTLGLQSIAQMDDAIDRVMRISAG